MTLRYRPVLDTEAPEIMTIELPQAGILIAQDIMYNKVHAVVSRQLDQWVAALKAIETRAGDLPVILRVMASRPRRRISPTSWPISKR